MHKFHLLPLPSFLPTFPVFSSFLYFLKWIVERGGEAEDEEILPTALTIGSNQKHSYLEQMRKAGVHRGR